MAANFCNPHEIAGKIDFQICIGIIKEVLQKTVDRKTNYLNYIIILTNNSKNYYSS